MNKVVERIMQVFGWRQAPEEENTQEALLDFLAKKPGTENDGAENPDFLKDLSI